MSSAGLWINEDAQIVLRTEDFHPATFPRATSLQVALAVLARREDGAERAATFLRERGWTATAPGTAPAEQPADRPNWIAAIDVEALVRDREALRVIASRNANCSDDRGLMSAAILHLLGDAVVERKEGR